MKDNVIALTPQRRYAAAVARFWRLSQDERDDLVDRAYDKDTEDLTFFEGVAMDEDAGAVVEAYDEWEKLSPAEQDAEIEAFERWEREEEGREPPSPPSPKGPL